mmetsp:Transcript_16327/g.18358  ORF Transcript_16327/g.18358 Transcript_16327/m.18358 type:complete len:87 (+) Transcript_16327:1173-1433(+)
MPVDRAGSDVAFLLHRGAGAYICGEETAVIDHFGITDDLASGVPIGFRRLGILIIMIPNYLVFFRSCQKSQGLQEEAMSTVFQCNN